MSSELIFEGLVFIKQYSVLPSIQQRHHGFSTTQKLQRHHKKQYLNDEDNLGYNLV